MIDCVAPKREIVRDPAPQPGQLQAIAQLDRDLVVSAGAGSGKTWVLTERYIEMLNRGTRPEQIVAITFTKKAAAEMKMRIRAALAHMEQTAQSMEEAHYWRTCQRDLERATITTIHGFCTTLLRDAPLEATLDPSFRILDETEAAMLERRVQRKVVDDWLAQGGAQAELLYRELGGRWAVLDAVHALVAQIRTYNVSQQQLLQETTATLDARRQTFHQLKQALKQLAVHGQHLVQEALDRNGKKPPPKYLQTAQSWLQTFSQLLTDAEEWDGTYEAHFVDRVHDLQKRIWRKNGSDDLKQLHAQLKDGLDEWLLHTEAPSYRELLHALLDLTTAVHASYEAKKSERQALDFNDLEQRALAMLRTHPEIAARWQQRIHYLMVDEFQDTNNLQKEILDSICGAESTVKRFVVGDSKQSIYKFRGADVTVFHRTGAEICAQGGAAVSLDVNFRTQQRLIAYVNSLFRFLMKKEADDPDDVVAYEPLVAFRKPPHTNASVELLPLTITEEMEDRAREIEAQRMAKRLRMMVERREPVVWQRPKGGSGNGASGTGGVEEARPVTYGDMAILLAARTHLHTYEQALSDEGIPYLVVGGRGFYEQQEVCDVLTVLRFVQNRDDEVALLAFLRAPFVHLSDEALYWLTREASLTQAFFYTDSAPEGVAADDWERLLRARALFKRWERMKVTENVYTLMRDIVSETGYLAILLAAPNGEQAVLNVEKLLKIAREADGEGFTLFEFLQWIDELVQADVQETEAEWIRDRGNAIVIMTVHASKGLEFPVVVLPDLAREGLKGTYDRALYAPGQGVAVRCSRQVSGVAEGDGLYDAFTKKERARDLQESYRLFYVAATRARDYLLMVGSQKETKRPSEELKNNWLDWVVKHLGYRQLAEVPDGVYNSAADWSMRVTWDLAEEAPREASSAAGSLCEQQTDATRRDGTEQRMSSAKEDAYPLYRPLSVEEVGTAEPAVYTVSALMDYEKCARLFVLKNRLQLPQSFAGVQQPQVGEKETAGETGPRAAASDATSLDVPERGAAVPDATSLDVPERAAAAQLGVGESLGNVAVPPTAVGNVLHRVLEQGRRPEALDAAIAQACRAERLDKTVHEHVAACVHPLAETYYRSDIYAAAEAAQRAWHEFPFHFQLAGHTVSGVIDLLYIDADGAATIVDFKSNDVHDDDHLEQLVTDYEVQLQLYALVVKQLLQVRVRRAVLYFLQRDTPVSIRVEPDLLESKKKKWVHSLHEMHRLMQGRQLPHCTDDRCYCRNFLFA